MKLKTLNDILQKTSISLLVIFIIGLINCSMFLLIRYFIIISSYPIEINPDRNQSSSNTPVKEVIKETDKYGELFKLLENPPGDCFTSFEFTKGGSIFTSSGKQYSIYFSGDCFGQPRADDSGFNTIDEMKDYIFKNIKK